MRIWGKIFQDNHLLRDTVAEDWDYKKSRTDKVLSMLQTICTELDLQVPIWQEINISDFQKHSKTRFRQESFVEQIDFDYLEFQVIEEDY